jgi:hypothetical protein
MLSEAVAEWVRLPLVPVTVNMKLPRGVIDDGVMVSVEVAVAGSVEKLEVAPAGTPLTVRFTALAKPFDGVIVTV